MTITDEKKKAKPALILILLGVLNGYIKHPFSFMIKTLVSFKKFKSSIKLELPKDFIDSAALMAWLYICLTKITSQKKAFEITRACIIVSGLSVQQANFNNVEAERNFQNLIKYQKQTNENGITRLNTMEIIEESEKKYEFNITRCLFFELFSYLKVPELTTIMCSIDNAIFNTYLPEQITFHRNGLKNTFPEGADKCSFVIETH